LALQKAKWQTGAALENALSSCPTYSTAPVCVRVLKHVSSGRHCRKKYKKVRKKVQENVQEKLSANFAYSTAACINQNVK